MKGGNLDTGLTGTHPRPKGGIRDQGDKECPRLAANPPGAQAQFYLLAHRNVLLSIFISQWEWQEHSNLLFQDLLLKYSCSLRFARPSVMHFLNDSKFGSMVLGGWLSR